MTDVRYLLPLAVALTLVSLPASAKLRADWSDVAALAPGSRVAVALHGDSPLLGKLKTRGELASVSQASLTLLTKDGQSITIACSAVRKVSVRLPVSRRTRGWIAAAVAFGAVQAYLSYQAAANSESLSPKGLAMAHGTLTTPVAFFALRGFRSREVYNVPAR